MILLGGPVYMDTKTQGRIPSTGIKLSEYDPDMVAKAHADIGYKAASIPYVPIENTTMLRDIEKAFKKHNIAAAEMGFWENLQDRDEKTRKANLDRMCKTLASADEMDVICAVDTVGAYSYGSVSDNFHAKSFGGDMFDMAVQNCRYILNTVKPKRTKFTYENFAFTALDTPQSIERLVKAVDDDRLAVHLDATNFVASVRDYFSFNDIIKYCFKQFGDKIVSCHIKDLQLESPALSVIMREVAPGTGALDMAYYLSLVNSLNKGIPCMIEHMKSEAEFDTGRKNLQKIMEQKGY
jgi:sugar phosphate isomerase/epimerase